ncbi:MBL fold metallo-hydrolase [Luteimonas sp. 3794]|uniref:MBL fold metallo-hydrolase n=1 Tax=Luteimonas sp. 3794 TaxID=2817730 RepID=UPI0028642C10|nr:MBL fold metallo-hydrolase [Luteimonas sp. 3794]MDR6991476.1 glyoxylase-like metal-dependent hydrolase (beta-lactamase superfamily II) [Luteimonas sp. 3794]
MKLWSIQGNTQKLDGGSMFGNAPRAMWTKWATPDDLNRIPLATRGLLATPLNGKTVLFETGIGAFFEPKLRERFGVQEDRHVLLDSLREAGFDHTDIDVVVLSHLHFDHAGGLLASWSEGAAPQLLFPNATFVLSTPHWLRAKRPHARDRASFIPGLCELLEATGRLEFIEGAHAPSLGDAVRFHYSDGHTPGMMLAEILGPDVHDGAHHGGVVFCADLVPGLPWVHVPITMGYDRFPELIIDEKQAFLADMAARGVRLFLTHDPDIALVQVVRDDAGRFSAIHPTAALAARSLQHAHETTP